MLGDNEGITVAVGGADEGIDVLAGGIVGCVHQVGVRVGAPVEDRRVVAG